MYFYFPAIFLICLTVPLLRIVQFPCDLVLTILLLCENYLMSFYLIREMYVLFQLRVVEVVNHVTSWTATEEEKAQGKKNWYMVNAKRFLKTTSYLCIFAFDTLVSLVCIIVLQVIDDSRNKGLGFTESCIYDELALHPINIVRMGMFAIKLLILLFMAIILFSYGNDSALIKQEVRQAMCTLGPCVIAHFILLNIVDWSDLVFGVYLLGVYLSIALSVGKPAYLTLYMDVDSEMYYYQGRQPDISNLADIINSRIGYNEFLRFLKSEFSEENLLFWREVQTFVNKCQKLLNSGNSIQHSDMNVLLEEKMFNRQVAGEQSTTALKIFEMYCKRGAEAQVNISDTVLHELQQQLSNLADQRVEVVLDNISNLFDSVKSQVFELMDKDSFARFKQNPIYINLREILITSGWVDTSGGETLDSFDLPDGLITVLDQDAERMKAMARRKEAQKVKPEVIRQQKKDQRAYRMLTVAAKLNRRHLLEMTSKVHLTTPLEVKSVHYPYKVPKAFVEWFEAQQDPHQEEPHEHKSILRTTSMYDKRGPHANTIKPHEQRVVIQDTKLSIEEQGIIMNNNDDDDEDDEYAVDTETYPYSQHTQHNTHPHEISMNPYNTTGSSSAEAYAVDPNANTMDQQVDGHMYVSPKPMTHVIDPDPIGMISPAPDKKHPSIYAAAMRGSGSGNAIHHGVNSDEDELDEEGQDGMLPSSMHVMAIPAQHDGSEYDQIYASEDPLTQEDVDYTSTVPSQVSRLDISAIISQQQQDNDHTRISTNSGMLTGATGSGRSQGMSKRMSGHRTSGSGGVPVKKDHDTTEDDTSVLVQHDANITNDDDGDDDVHGHVQYSARIHTIPDDENTPKDSHDRSYTKPGMDKHMSVKSNASSHASTNTMRNTMNTTNTTMNNTNISQLNDSQYYQPNTSQVHINLMNPPHPHQHHNNGNNGNGDVMIPMDYSSLLNQTDASHPDSTHSPRDVMITKNLNETDTSENYTTHVQYRPVTPRDMNNSHNNDDDDTSPV